jgi:hypothetical protein
VWRGLGQCISLLECVPVNSDVYSRGLGSRFAGEVTLSSSMVMMNAPVMWTGEGAHTLSVGTHFFSIWKGKERFFSPFGKERNHLFSLGTHFFIGAII